MDINDIRGAVIRGWTRKATVEIIMETALVEAITEEVNELFLSDCEPHLGCATTRTLLAEISARLEIDGRLDYRTIDTWQQKS